MVLKGGFDLKSYDYPMEETWTKQEIINVIEFFNLVEKAYEAKVNRDELLSAYHTFKKIVPAKGEEKSYFSQFEKSSGYSSYHVVKQARESSSNEISMGHKKR